MQNCTAAAVRNHEKRKCGRRDKDERVAHLQQVLVAYAQSQSLPLLSTTQPDQLRTTHTSFQDCITMRSFAILATICAATVGTTSGEKDKQGCRRYIECKDMYLSLIHI